MLGHYFAREVIDCILKMFQKTLTTGTLTAATTKDD